jgi:hypothetical protein
MSQGGESASVGDQSARVLEVETSARSYGGPKPFVEPPLTRVCESERTVGLRRRFKRRFRVHRGSPLAGQTGAVPIAGENSIGGHHGFSRITKAHGTRIDWVWS